MEKGTTRDGIRTYFKINFTRNLI